MPEGGSKSSLVPNVAVRAARAVRYAISGVGNDTWFGPAQPLQPMAPADTAGRIWDYPVSYNIQIMPRAFTAIAFRELRTIADNCDILRMVIEATKDRIESMDYGFKAVDPKDKTDYTAPIKELSDFFAYPDKEHDWSQWVRMIGEEVNVIDALSIYKRRNKAGKLFALDIIDGTTIALKIDDCGRRPAAPDPAYQQILHGVPAVDYPSTNLLYMPRNVRAQSPYGLSRTEQIIVMAMTEIHRMRSQLEYFTEGSVPDAFGTVPTSWNAQQIDAAEVKLNSLLSGNTAARRRMKLMPDGFKLVEPKPPPIKDEFDEWIARKICYCFNVSPQTFIKMGSRAESDTAKDTAKESGTAIDAHYIKRVVNRIILEEWPQYADKIMFDWQDQTDQDALEASTIDSNLVKNCIQSVNEAREGRGLDPVDGGDEPMALTATGWVPLPGSKMDQQMQQQKQDAAQQNQDHQLALAAARPAPIVGDPNNPDKPTSTPAPANDDDETETPPAKPKKKPASKLGKRGSGLSAIPFRPAYSRQSPVTLKEKDSGHTH